MRIGILAAMSKEVALLSPLIQDCKEVSIDASGKMLYMDDAGTHPGILKVWTGKVEGHDVCLMQCGIGKVNSALNTRRLIEFFNPDLVINSGVAGGAGKAMNIGDLLIATEASYHDVWCGPGTEYGAADGMQQRIKCSQSIVNAARGILNTPDVKFGLICTGDKFISTPEEIKAIREIFPDVLACDMESAAIGQVCSLAGKEYAIVRVVSDTPGEGENISQYRNFWSEAPEKTFSALVRLLGALGA